jgi:hypothetical protein
MKLTPKQVNQLLRPINENRVLQDGKGHSHVSQQDVTANLIRVFGFCNFDVDILNVDLVFEDPRVNQQNKPTGRWDVCYRAMVRVTVKDPDGNELAHYEDGSTATAQNQTRGDAHDLAYKSSISLSKKRAATNLGDQFGLSLYNKGQLSALVMGTLIMPDATGDTQPVDMQDGVEKQVSLGNDEIDREEVLSEGVAPPTLEEYRQRGRAASTEEELKVLFEEATRYQLAGAPMLDDQGDPTILADYLRGLVALLRAALRRGQPAPVADRADADAEAAA